MKTKMLSSLAACALAVTALSLNAFGTTTSSADRSSVDQMITSWPARPRLAAQEMMVKYGVPPEVSSETLIWRDAGPYKRIMVTKMEIPHDFPKPHMDFLEHTVSFNVPADKVSDLVAFDSSMTINKTAGEMSARCDLEGHNILTLNLARDIIAGTKTVPQARAAFAQNIADDLADKHPAYVYDLQFKPNSKNAAFADMPNIPGSPVRVAQNQSSDQGGKQQMAGMSGDSEILAKVIAVDDNEVLASTQAKSKKISQPVLDFAKMIHREHGANQTKVMKLGQSLGIKPTDTMAVDQLRVKGADELSKIVPLDGNNFEKAFLDTMIKGHTEALAMLDQQLIPNAQNSAVKKQLAETRAHVASHLDQAKKLQQRA